MYGPMNGRVLLLFRYIYRMGTFFLTKPSPLKRRVYLYQCSVSDQNLGCWVNAFINLLSNIL